MRFQIYGKTSQAAKCVKSRIMTKVIDYVLSIDTFEQKCVVLKCMLQSPCLKDHMKTIGIDQSLSNSAIFENMCLQNTNKLYKNSRKRDDQQQFKDIFEAAMFLTPEGLTANSTISPITPPTLKKKSARKSLCLLTNTLQIWSR